MTQSNRPPARPYPTLLSKSDAMLHAATMLEDLANDMALGQIMMEVFGKPELLATAPEDILPVLEDLKVRCTGIVAMTLQETAMRAAAAIRAAANEEKLVEARAYAAGDRVRQ